jgi:hypothetical protein
MQDNQGAIDSVSKAADLDPTVLLGVAGYIRGLAIIGWTISMPPSRTCFRQKRAASKYSATACSFAEIYERKQDTGNAAAQIRAYLKEAPQGPFAAQLRDDLDQIDKQAALASGDKAHADIAP